MGRHWSTVRAGSGNPGGPTFLTLTLALEEGDAIIEWTGVNLEGQTYYLQIWDEPDHLVGPLGVSSGDATNMGATIEDIGLDPGDYAAYIAFSEPAFPSGLKSNEITVV